MFVGRVTHRYQVPCLRDEAKVTVLVHMDLHDVMVELAKRFLGVFVET
jgi:hypothetical protein